MIEHTGLNQNLYEVDSQVYDRLSLSITNVVNEREGVEYDACRFQLNGMNIISRSSKTTPKKSGQFVTFWKRDQLGETAPHSENDPFDFYIVQSRSRDQLGQFVFPKSVLIKKGYIRTALKDGKRGFRVYPIWDQTSNKQAEKTQDWQLKYFYKIDELTNLNKVRELYGIQ
ncbi:MepB family protein [Phaeocystidibacter marisrubri]|uniref:MepB family protein n=1 Tax=Phaeocystidibacter marisrubri TaxID=1577780 RepID=A0A6L3ZJD0_9FLAO|nr:MepB family protein [Phaeocystidibacter marisrubri]KAB2817668.1 MepB family protein [Phaeocystidibacter marisrubri]GGH74198.1 hypothetical protein GCM10011318_19920 [Phaeocystidibacter marisrubri]